MASSPAVVGGRVVYHGMNGAVYVLNRATGRLLWHRYIGSPIECTKSGLVRQQLRERNLFFAGLRKLRPELGHALVDVDLVLLQGMQHTRAADSFRCRPNKNDGI